MAKALSVADYVIKQAQKEKKPVSNLKLQKILYFLNVIHLIKYDKPLITDYKFEKWLYGPVIHSIYSEYSSNGADFIKIPKRYVKKYYLSPKEGKVVETHYSEKDLKLPENAKNFIEDNLGKLLKFNTFKLVDYSHEEPQWNDKENIQYNDNATIDYYSDENNRFWEK